MLFMIVNGICVHLVEYMHGITNYHAVNVKAIGNKVIATSVPISLVLHLKFKLQQFFSLLMFMRCFMLCNIGVSL